MCENNWRNSGSLTHKEDHSSNELFFIDLKHHSWETGSWAGDCMEPLQRDSVQMGSGCLWRTSIKPRTFSHAKKKSSPTRAGAGNSLTSSPWQKVSRHWGGADNRTTCYNLPPPGEADPQSCSESCADRKDRDRKRSCQLQGGVQLLWGERAGTWRKSHPRSSGPQSLHKTEAGLGAPRKSACPRHEQQHAT